MTLLAAFQRISAAHKFLHGELCSEPTYPCRGCQKPLTVAHALDHLDARPRDARGVRWIFHDYVCTSGCDTDSNHADRTQATTAAALRRFRATEVIS